MPGSLVNVLIGEYRLTEPLGAGGMGEVYKAVHVHLSRVIAVKILFPELADGPALQRFYGEADIQATLRHPGVADYLGFYEYQGRPCILMEYVDGETLASLIRLRGAFPPAEAAAILREISAVAGHFHSLGVVHRDLKTSNVKLNSAGRVKILDFGIARHQRSNRLTRAGAVIGTAEILAPEQIRGEEGGFATDVWQIGILFYELLSGRMPFEASTTHELYARILSAHCPPLGPGVPPEFQRIVAKCLEKDPSRRYASGGALHQAIEGHTGAAPRLPGTRTVAIAAGCAAVVVLLAGGVVALRKSGPQGGGTVIEQGVDEKSITVDAAGGIAEVYQDGKLMGNTPFTVHAKTGESVNLVLKRQGFDDKPVQFDATERQTYTYTLDPRKEP